jgi:hypothetical protein
LLKTLNSAFAPAKGDGNVRVLPLSSFPTFQILFTVLKFLKLVSANQIHIPNIGSIHVSAAASTHKADSAKAPEAYFSKNVSLLFATVSQSIIAKVSRGTSLSYRFLRYLSVYFGGRSSFSGKTLASSTPSGS